MIAAFSGRRDIGVIGWLRTFAASLVPFGTFVNDARMIYMPETDAAYD